MNPQSKKRLQWLDQTVARRFRKLHPSLYQHLRWPVRKPYQRSTITLLPPGGGIGDELLASGIVAEINRRNPACTISLISRQTGFWKGHPKLVAITREAANPDDVFDLGYRWQVPSSENIFTLIGERVGLSVSVLKPSLPPLSPSMELVATLEKLPRPWLVVQTDSSAWTPNKNWGNSKWRQTVIELSRTYSVIETGNKSVLNTNDLHDRLVTVAGRTTLHDVAWLIGQSAVFTGPESGGMHFAAAFDKPAVIVFGGYTAPENFPYPGNHGLFTELSCSPCWLYEPCPWNLKCLAAIRPESVIEKVSSLVANGGPLLAD
ncbi:MAG TPA: glycosyltransferase family 9 protein [Roseimicrobium sp.]|nr:glycosyltransferase family 9 protein [Roseimicrobium sp.]